MNKLTAEVARRDIGHLREHQASPKIGLSLREELYLQALEIALPVIEQQEKGNDGWIEWGGGSRPVKGDTVLETRWSDGDTVINRADAMTWEHDKYCNLIAYRVIENDGREG